MELRVTLFPPVSPVSLESGIGDCSRNVHAYYGLSQALARRSMRRAAQWVWRGNYLGLIRCELAGFRKLLSFAFRLLRGFFGMRQRFLRMLQSFLGMLERFLSVGFGVSF